MNTITDLLNLEDSQIVVEEVLLEGGVKTLVLGTPASIHFCPLCSFRMHSKGIKTRTVNHPILQGSQQCILKLKQRRWKCINPLCRYEVNEAFNFVSKGKRNTNTTEMLIVESFKDPTLSAAAIALKYNVSDTYALSIFDKYVKLDRLPLSDIISVDEVHLNLDDDCAYALVIQDFYTGEPIDLLRTRRSRHTEPYFTSIPREERCQVKYLISDMYNPYIRYVDKYFPNAVAVVDSFHVIQWITHSIDTYIRKLIKRFKERDRLLYEQKWHPEVMPATIPISNEVYLLQKYRWLILSNPEHISYHSDAHMDTHLNCLMNTYDYEDALFRLDPQLQELRDYKDMYIDFNTRNAGKPMDARIELDELIGSYLDSGNAIFRDFANLLIKYHDYIINSFIMVERHGLGKAYPSRLSNGPIEGLNRKIKDLKRLGRGYRNFQHFRTRFLYAARNNPVLQGDSEYLTTYDYYEEQY